MKKLIVSLFTAAILAATGSSLIGNVPTVFADEQAKTPVPTASTTPEPTPEATVEPTPTPITSIKVQVDNPMMTVNEVEESITDDNATPEKIYGRTLVPIRVFEVIGANVDWKENNKTGIQTVTLTYKDKTIVLTIGEKLATVNGNEITLDVAPTVIKGRTKMPIRFISETFGFDVRWYPAEDPDVKEKIEICLPSDIEKTNKTTYEHDTFDNTTNYSSKFGDNTNNKYLSLSYDGEYYYYVAESDGKAYRYNNSSNEEELKFTKADDNNYIDNMRVFKNHLVGIIKENANDEGRAFISNTDGSNFDYFAKRTGGARDYSRNIITRNEGDKNYIYLLDSSDQQSYLRKFELNGDKVTEVEGRVFDKRLYAYSITDDYEMYIDYTDFNLHCIKRSSNATIDLGFPAYRLNNDHENFYTFKKTVDGAQYIPCRITKESLDKVFKGEKKILDAVDTAVENTNSVKRLTVTKDENGTRIFYFDSEKTPAYQKIIFND